MENFNKTDLDDSLMGFDVDSDHVTLSDLCEGKCYLYILKMLP